MAIFGSKTAAAPQQTGAAQPVQAGAMFGLPGVTQPTYQPENNDQTTVTLASATQTPFSSVVNFKNTDVIVAWELDLSITNTFTAGTTTTTSAYFPYNFVGPVKIQIQNMYSSIDVLSGIDLALFELLHPSVRGDSRQYLGAAPGPVHWAGADASLQSDLVTSTTATSGTTPILLTLMLPVSLFFDVYYDLAVNGQPTMAPHRALVSPQWMSGISRSVSPAITYNAGIGSTSDVSPYVVSGTTLGTFSGSVLQGFQRKGFYGNNNPGTQPPVYNWQSQRVAKQYTMGAVSSFPINIPPGTGQILALYVRLFNPSASSNAGAAIDLSAVSACQLKYGSGQFMFNDTPLTMQKRLFQQLGIKLPVGVIAWLLCLDDWGRWNNALALNTYTTAGVSVQINFTSAQSSTAYAVLGIESLAYVEQ